MLTIINEILNTERDYINHLWDSCKVMPSMWCGEVEGRPDRWTLSPELHHVDMFSERKRHTIFGKIKDFYGCHKAFVKTLEQKLNTECPPPD